MLLSFFRKWFSSISNILSDLFKLDEESLFVEEGFVKAFSIVSFPIILSISNNKSSFSFFSCILLFALFSFAVKFGISWLLFGFGLFKLSLFNISN